jgi:hypothetical protein
MVSGLLYGFSICYVSLVDVYTDMSVPSHLNWVCYVLVEEFGDFSIRNMVPLILVKTATTYFR